MHLDPVRICLVDDDEDDYLIVRGLLSKIHTGNFLAQWVSSADEAVKLMSHNEHDVFLLDYRLGEQSGLDVLRDARAAGCCRPIIILTGYDNHSIDVEATELGAEDYLVKKQINPILLERSIRHAIERHRLRAELESALVQLEHASQAEKRFLAATSHDVRGTLSGIMGFADLLNQANLPESVADLPPRIVSLTRTLSDMMADLLEHAGLRPFLTEKRPASDWSGSLVAIRSVLADCAAVVELRCQDKGLSFKVDLPVDIAVHTDRVTLMRIVQNLLSNAIRYTPKGKIHLRTEVTPTELCISVQDTGIGIPAEELDKIFTDFYRLEPARKMEPLGSGLGLATVKRLCQRLGGTVHVESDVGIGSTFSVRIPRITAEEASRAFCG